MILIRADANEKIGTGHVMRCLSLASAFHNDGQKVMFLTADHRGDKLIKSRGFESICLDSEWTDMESEDADIAVKSCRPDLLLVDSYFATEPYMHSLTKTVRLAYIDDMNAAQWDVDYLINYNIFGTVMDYTKYSPSHTSLILGPRFAPLRDEFKDIQKHKIKQVTDIMVSAGGADPEGITEKLMTGICPEMSDIRFHFIVGALNPRLDKIKEMVTPNIILHINEENMSGLMQSCDIAISAAGSTLYELCACGTPTITYTLADNQLVAADEFEKQGLMVNAGDCRNNEGFERIIGDELNCLIDDPKKREQLSTRMQTLVDGRGAERIIKEIWDNIVIEALEAVREDCSIHLRNEDSWLAIGKSKNGQILVVTFEMINEEEKILHSCFANEVEVNLYNGD